MGRRVEYLCRDALCLIVDCTSPQMSYHAAVVKSVSAQPKRERREGREGTKGTGRAERRRGGLEKYVE